MTYYLIRYVNYLENVQVSVHPTREEGDAALVADEKDRVASADANAFLVGEDEELWRLLGSKALVDLFNMWRAESDKPVTKFETRAVGRKRFMARLSSRFGGGPPETTAEEAPPQPEGGADVAQPGNSEEDDMAKKAKKTAKTAKRAKGSAPKRQAAPLFVELTGSAPTDGMTSGCYIRSLLMTGKFTTDQILEKVKKYYTDSTAKPSDVSWNKGKLKAANKKVPEVAKKD